MTWTAQEKSRIVGEYHRDQSITLTQRWVRTRINKEPPAQNKIIRWERNFRNHGSPADSAKNRMPRSSD